MVVIQLSVVAKILSIKDVGNICQLVGAQGRDFELVLCKLHYLNTSHVKQNLHHSDILVIR